MNTEPVRKKRRKRKRKWYIPIMIVAIVVFLGFQLAGVYSKLSTFRQKEASLTEQLEAAMVRQQELEDYEAYTHTSEYIMNTARSKLGMVRENEIIFKEN